MRLRNQLFLTLLLTSGLLITLMALINSWSFDRGFIGYINDTERQRLEPLVEDLATGYAREGNWDWIATDRAGWKALFDTHFGQRRLPPGAGDRPAPPPNDGAALTLDSQLLLADAERQVLIGQASGDQHVRWQSVTVDDQAVGYLGHRQREALPGQLDQAFATRQRRVFAYAALAMALLSALLAVTLADRLSRPLLEINNALTRISRGQYSHRVPDSRGDELGELSRNINTLARALERNLDARRQWLAEISHELRTPVAVLQGELEAIEDGVNRFDSNAIASLHSEIVRLARLVDDLHDLALSDVGALDYHFEPVDLAHVLTARVAATRHYTDTAELVISVGLPPQPLFIDGDIQRLGQLIDNLMQNSFRYTDAKGQVCISLRREHDRAVIDWSDSAPGVDNEQLAHLFDPLYRTDDSRHRESGGAGLGLTIVQRIVDAHRGNITVGRSGPGGLAFHIDMPLATEVAA